MKKRQTRFTTEQQIIDKIDAGLSRLKELREHDLECMSNEEAEKVKAQARRLEEATLPRLKRTLAAFRTKPMPFSDDAVVLQ